MAKPYRRRKGKGKGAPYVGNFRVNIGGKDLNLGTKDAEEANRRARLASKGMWPPVDAAAAAAAAVLDPASKVLDEGAPSLAAQAVVIEEPARGASGPSAAPRAETHSQPPDEPLNDAAAAAAGDAGAEEDEARAADQQRGVDDELAAVMAELGGGANGADLLDAVADGVAAGLLWAEGKAIEFGVNWRLSKSGKRFEAGQPGADSIMRKSLKVGLKGAAIVHFPDFASKLTPGIAIAVGLIGGIGPMVAGGKIIDVKTGASQSAADAMTSARAAAAADVTPTA